jgi:hypothetical protein
MPLSIPRKIPIEEVEITLRASLGNGYSIIHKEGAGLLENKLFNKFNSWISRVPLQTTTILIARNRWEGCRLRVYTIGERETYLAIEGKLPSRLAQIVCILGFPWLGILVCWKVCNAVEQALKPLTMIAK